MVNHEQCYIDSQIYTLFSSLSVACILFLPNIEDSQTLISDIYIKGTILCLQYITDLQGMVTPSQARVSPSQATVSPSQVTNQNHDNIPAPQSALVFGERVLAGTPGSETSPLLPRQGNTS